MHGKYLVRMHYTRADIFGCPYDLKVEYSHYAAIFGRTDGGVPIEPDEPEFIEIGKVFVNTLVGWIEFDTSNEWDLEITDEILEEIEYL